MTNLGHGPLIMGIVWTLTGIATIVVALRFYLRIKVIEKLSWDDWIMLTALVFQITHSIILTIAYYHGLGMHDVDLTVHQMVELLKWVWIQVPPGVMVSTVARISIIILLVRIFGKHTWFKWFLYTTGVFQTSLAVVFIPVTFVQCKPVQGLWDSRIKRVCWDPSIRQNLGYALQSLFAFSDLTYVLIPCVFVYKLNMSLKHKLGLILVLCLGLFTMAASIIKVTYVGSRSAAADSQYRASIAILWSVVEQELVIIMGCSPILRSVTKLELPSYVETLVSSISSLVSGGSHRSSEASSNPNTGTSGPSRPETVNRDKKNDSKATYHVYSFQEHGSEPSSVTDDHTHESVDFAVDHDRASA